MNHTHTLEELESMAQQAITITDKVNKQSLPFGVSLESDLVDIPIDEQLEYDKAYQDYCEERAYLKAKRAAKHTQQLEELERENEE
jgi:hypothetical protein